jgi:hypothetical protein
MTAGTALAAALGLLLAWPASAPTLWPSSLAVSSPAGVALLHSARPKTVMLDPRTGATTAVYAGYVLLPWISAGADRFSRRSGSDTHDNSDFLLAP